MEHVDARRSPILAGLACLLAAGLAACGGGSEGSAAAGLAGAGAEAAPTQPASKAVAAEADPAPQLETLRGVRPPDPTGFEGNRAVDLDNFVRNRAAAVQLGKALFWDVSVGSDGRTACASCHFQAGADSRIKNQINPGLRNVQSDLADNVGRLFNQPARSKGWGPNYTLTAADFPLHRLVDALDRNSKIRSTTDDVIASQGVYQTDYRRPGNNHSDKCRLQADDMFQVNGRNTRKVEPRNSPTVINAALNVRNFWDGRANNVFNGWSPFGDRDPAAGIWRTRGDGQIEKVRLALKNASAASQAVGPPGSDFEMSCGGRAFPDIARRLLDNPILKAQSIHPDDSVLHHFAQGARPKYNELIMAAFRSQYWDSNKPVQIDAASYSLMEANFSLFFGLAVQMYESTLLSDETPLDAYLQGDRKALTAQEIRGMKIFTGKGLCINCHNGPELTNAATRLRLSSKELVERMFMGDRQVAIYDSGFYNIGVRPTPEDLGVGGTDPWNNPLSFTRQYRSVIMGGKSADPFRVDPCRFEVLLSTSIPCDPSIKPGADFRDAVDGAFKTPTLRNIELTGPYFHNGSQATLEQVVEFYNRGGDRRGSDDHDTTGFGPNRSNIDADIRPLGLTQAEQDDLVAFMKRPLTDPRVEWERAPFDHPSIDIPNGHQGDEKDVLGSDDPRTPRIAKEETLRLKAVGRDGRARSEGALRPFHAGLK